MIESGSSCTVSFWLLIECKFLLHSRLTHHLKPTPHVSYNLLAMFPSRLPLNSSLFSEEMLDVALRKKPFRTTDQGRDFLKSGGRKVECSGSESSGPCEKDCLWAR